MLKVPKKDLSFTFFIAMIFIIYITFFSLPFKYTLTNPNFVLFIDNLLLDQIFLIFIFISSGYSLLALIYSDQTPEKLLKQPFLLLISAALLSILVSIFLNYVIYRDDLQLLILILSGTTIILSLIAYRRRLKFFDLERKKR